MNLFFGKKKVAAPKQANTIDTISLLDGKIETLYKRDQLLHTRVESCKREALAKKKKGDKTGALIALKKANRYEEETRKLQGTIMTLENQKIALESASSNVEVIKVMDIANQTLVNVHKDLNPEKIDKIMDDMEEQRDMSDQISEALTRNNEDMFDDEDLLAELEGLEDELNLIDEEERAPAIPTKPKKTATPATSAPEVVFDFPSAPQGKLQQPQKQAAVESEDERELRLLQESMLA